MSRLQISSILIAVVGLVDSAYLAWIKITSQESICQGIGDCEAVNTSVYSEIAGIPIALLGVGAYLAILALHFLEQRTVFWRDNGVLFLFGIVLAGVIYSAYLTYIELFVLRAVCPFCVVSALALVALLIIALVRLFQPQSSEI